MERTSFAFTKEEATNSALYNTTKELGVGIERKNSCIYVYYCPECGRMHNVKVRTKVDLIQYGKQKNPKEPVMKAPEVNIVAPDGVSVTCVCGTKMISTVNSMIWIADVLSERFGITEVSVNDPIAPTGSSYNPRVITIRDEPQSPEIQTMVEALINILANTESGYFVHLDVKVTAKNDQSTDECTLQRIKNKSDRNMMLMNFREIMKDTGSYLVIEEVFHKDMKHNTSNPKFMKFFDILYTEMAKLSGKDQVVTDIYDSHNPDFATAFGEKNR